MRSSLNILLHYFVLSSLGSFQDVFRLQEDQHSQPFGIGFDEKVDFALEHFRIPGIAVAVSHGGDLVSRVGNSIRGPFCSKVLELIK